jgi:cell division transport system permease protein
VTVFLRYAFKETGSNIWRNAAMTLAAILTVWISLTLVGGALLVKQATSHAAINWEHQTRVTVWMRPHATSPEISTIGQELKLSAFVVHPCQYLDKEQNYLAAKEDLNVNAFDNLRVSDMPTSYVCEPTVPTDVSAVISTFTGAAGVLQVSAPVKSVINQEHFLHNVQWILLVIALVLLISAVVLILNTIRLAIFGRRREVTVMKLVGATNWFIRIPFVAEGFIQGLLGSVIACLTLTLAHTWIRLPLEYALSNRDLLGSLVVVMVVGIVIGTVGSTFAIRRFLDV